MVQCFRINMRKLNNFLWGGGVVNCTKWKQDKRMFHLSFPPALKGICYVLSENPGNYGLWTWHLQWLNIPTVLEIPPVNSKRCSILVAAPRSLWMPIVECLTWMRDLCEEVSHNITMCYSLSVWLQPWVRLTEAKVSCMEAKKKPVQFILITFTT